MSGIAGTTPRLSARRTSALAGGVIVLLTLLVYLPAIRGGFIWNDDTDVVDNIVLQDNGLARVWFTTESRNYWPIVWTSYWIEYQLWGLNPMGYHIVNVLIHAGCGLLVWRVLLRLAIPGAWLAALFFAIHPVNVESAAWITQQKNTLALLFFLTSVLMFLRYEDLGRPHRLGLAAFTFLLAMLSKGAAAPLPAVLLLCVWWRRGTIRRRDLLHCVPFLVIAVGMSGVEVWFQYVRAIADDVVRSDSPASRLAGAGWVVWFYLDKALLPVNLSFVYPRWVIDSSSGWSYVPGAALLALLAAAWRRRRGWGRPVLFALGYFVITLGPVLGFLNIYFMRFSFVADHYQYVAIIGIIALAVGGGAAGLRLIPHRGVWIGRIAAVVIAAALSWMSWRQAHIYRDPERLWTDTLAKNPDAWIAHNNLAVAIEKRGRRLEAMDHYRRALSLEPDFAKAHTNLGNALLLVGDAAAAERHYREALALQPAQPDAHYHLANALKTLGRLRPAEQHYQMALRAKPDYAYAHFQLAATLRALGETDRAIRHYRLAIDADPDYAHPHYGLANIFKARGDRDPAIRHFRRAVELDPDYGDAHYDLAVELQADNRLAEAMMHYRRAIRADPAAADARNNLGTLLQSQGDVDAAIEQYRSALEIDPGLGDAHFNLGTALVARRRFGEAVRHLRTAADLQPDAAPVHYQLAWALVHDARPRPAIGHFQQAMRLDPAWTAPPASLAWILATHPSDDVRDPEQAVRHASRAVELAGAGEGAGDANLLDTLAAAHAAAGHFELAVRVGRRAVAAAQSSGSETLAERIKARVRIYEGGAPYRDAGLRSATTRPSPATRSAEP